MAYKVVLVSIIVFLLFAAAFFVRSNTVYDGGASINTETPRLHKDVLLGLIQDWRMAQSKRKYIEHPKLCEISDKRVGDKVLDNHSGFIENYSGFSHVIAENLAYGFNETHVLNMWLNSPSHRAILDMDFKYTCLSVSENYAVQIFSSLGE